MLKGVVGVGGAIGEGFGGFGRAGANSPIVFFALNSLDGLCSLQYGHSRPAIAAAMPFLTFSSFQLICRTTMESGRNENLRVICAVHCVKTRRR